MGATPFARYGRWRMRGDSLAAISVTIGLAVSLLPIVLRVLSPLARDARTQERDPNYRDTVWSDYFSMLPSSPAWS
jgi:hypothetical protein